MLEYSFNYAYDDDPKSLLIIIYCLIGSMYGGLDCHYFLPIKPQCGTIYGGSVLRYIERLSLLNNK